MTPSSFPHTFSCIVISMAIWICFTGCRKRDTQEDLKDPQAQQGSNSHKLQNVDTALGTDNKAVITLGNQAQPLTRESNQTQVTASMTNMNVLTALDNKSGSRVIITGSAKATFIDSKSNSFWEVDVVESSGIPSLQGQKVRTVAYKEGKVIATIGKHSFIEVDPEKRTTRFLGSD